MELQLHRFGPKAVDHPSVTWPCAACSEPLGEGSYTVLVPIGPGKDPEEREKCRNGQHYNAIALEAHWACVTGQEEVLDK